MVTGIAYHGVEVNNNHCLLKAIDKAMHHRSHVMSKLLVIAK